MSSEQKTILIVDDEETLTWSMSKNLSLNKEYKIICANSGEEAMEILDRTPDIDLVVSDIKMQDKNGLQVLSEVKTKYPQIGFVIMTAYGSDKKRREAMDKGAIRYIEKPFMMDQIKQIIKEALEETERFFQPIDEGLKQKIKNNQALQELLLTKNRQIPELLSIKLAAIDGETLLQEGNEVGGDDFKIVQPTKVLGKIQAVGKKIGAGQLQGISLSSEKHNIVLRSLGDSPFFLYLIFEQSLIMGKVILAVRQLESSIGELL